MPTRNRLLYLSIFIFSWCLMCYGCGALGDKDSSDNQKVIFETDPKDDPSSLNGPDFKIDYESRAAVLLTSVASDNLTDISFRISRVGAKKDNGQWIYSNIIDPSPFNISNLSRGGMRPLTDGIEFSSGSYKSLRLVLDKEMDVSAKLTESKDTVNFGEEKLKSYTVDIPYMFTIEKNLVKEHVLAFDLRQSFSSGDSPSGVEDFSWNPSIHAMERQLLTNFQLQLTKDVDGIACLYSSNSPKSMLSKADANCAGSITSAKSQNGSISFYFLADGDYVLVLLSKEQSYKLPVSLGRETGATVYIEIP